MEGALLDQSFGYVENMERQFAAAQAEVERQIAAWYQRFADANGITFADAKRLLTKGELAEFHWTVGEYIAHGQQNARMPTEFLQLVMASLSLMSTSRSKMTLTSTPSKLVLPVLTKCRLTNQSLPGRLYGQPAERRHARPGDPARKGR